MIAITKIRLIVVVLLCVVMALLTVGCSQVEELPYKTTCDQEELQSLRGRKLILIRFDYEENMLVGDTAEPSVGGSIAQDQKDYFMTAFKTYFEIVDATGGEDLTEGGPPVIEDVMGIQGILNDAYADGAILVTNGYGYELSSGDPLLVEAASNVVEAILEEVISEKAADWFQGLSGPSFIVHYYLVSDTIIVNRSGEVVWRFFGKATASPPPLSGTVGEELETFTRSLAGGDPTSQELDRAMDGMHEPYIDYLLWVLESDLEESTAINYFTDYPVYDDRGPVAVFPALDQTHVPAVRTAEEIEEYEEVRENSLWTVAKSGEWRTPGQWRQAWAALKLLGISFLIIIPIVVINGWVEKRTKEGEGCLTLQLLGLAIWISMLASIYLLLKAIL